MHMNYSQIMSPAPLCLEKWGIMTPSPSSYGSAAPDDDDDDKWATGQFSM